MKASLLFFMVGVVLINSQLLYDQNYEIGFVEYIQGHYGRCCHIQYVFSLDKSGSMSSFAGSANTFLSDWKAWLENMRINSHDYWVSSHTFDLSSSNQLIHRTPTFWSPFISAGGGTDWDRAIEFLTDRLNLRDHICYTMVTDLHPDYISIQQSTANAFAEAYKRFTGYGCSFYFRIIDVRSLPQQLALRTSLTAPDTQSIKYPTNLSKLLSSLGINYTYIKPTDPRQVSRYYRCANNL